jgi:hypothetical protein
MVLSFIALTPAAMPAWMLSGAWVVPVLLVTGIVLIGVIPDAQRGVFRRLIAALVLAVVLSAGLIASEFIIVMSPCSGVEPHSFLWYALGCWW